MSSARQSGIWLLEYFFQIRQIANHPISDILPNSIFWYINNPFLIQTVSIPRDFAGAISLSSLSPTITELCGWHPANSTLLLSKAENVMLVSSIISLALWSMLLFHQQVLTQHQRKSISQPRKSPLTIQTYLSVYFTALFNAWQFCRRLFRPQSG